jgi:hypothetical protein
MSPRLNWDSPNPSLASECARPQNRGGAHSPAGEGVGKSRPRILNLLRSPETIPRRAGKATLLVVPARQVT